MELIEYLASPGTGKTTAAFLELHLRKADRGIVEFIREVPQEFFLAGRGNFGNGNQALYLGTYLRKVLDLKDMGYETVICDSSFMTNLLYPDNVFNGVLLSGMVDAGYEHLNKVGIGVTINVLSRDKTRKHIQLGRRETEAESDAIQESVIRRVEELRDTPAYRGVTFNFGGA